VTTQFIKKVLDLVDSVLKHASTKKIFETPISTGGQPLMYEILSRHSQGFVNVKLVNLYYHDGSYAEVMVAVDPDQLISVDIWRFYGKKYYCESLHVDRYGRLRSIMSF